MKLVMQYHSGSDWDGQDNRICTEIEYESAEKALMDFEKELKLSPNSYRLFTLFGLNFYSGNFISFVDGKYEFNLPEITELNEWWNNNVG